MCREPPSRAPRAQRPRMARTQYRWIAGAPPNAGRCALHRACAAPSSHYRRAPIVVARLVAIHDVMSIRCLAAGRPHRVVTAAKEGLFKASLRRIELTAEANQTLRMWTRAGTGEQRGVREAPLTNVSAPRPQRGPAARPQDQVPQRQEPRHRVGGQAGCPVSWNNTAKPSTE